MSTQPQEKTAPVQGHASGIPWSMHLRAYDVYCQRYGAQEALITGWCRGGFHVDELDMFIPGWREELKEVTRLRSRVAELERFEKRLLWLHTGGEKDTQGCEWGVFRVKWDAHGRPVEVWQTNSDFSDLDREMAASAPQPPAR